MLYQGFFRSLKDTLYKVEFVTNNDTTGTVEIMLGATPFASNTTTSSNTCYTPIKATTATVSIVGNTYLFDLYASKAKDIPVTLYKHIENSETWMPVFKGYAQPNQYSAPYDFVTETYDVECIDALGILQYFDYEAGGKTLVNEANHTYKYDKRFRTFKDIICDILGNTGLITDFYFANNFTIQDSGNSNPPISLMTISEQNFFNDNDKPMNHKDVLEEICKFCGVSAICEGGAVYFIDYDSIKAGYNTYSHYLVDGTLLAAVNTLLDPKTITGDSYFQTGSTISLDNTYSKVTVKGNLYEVGSLIHSMFENDDLQNTNYVDEGHQNFNYEYTTSCKENDTWFNIHYKFYTNKAYDHSYFDCSGNTVPGPVTNMLIAETTLGAAFCKFNIGTGKSQTDAYNSLDYGNWVDYLMLPMSGSSMYDKVRLSSKPENVKPFFMSSDAKILMQGSILFTDRGTFDNGSGGDANIGYWPQAGTVTSHFNLDEKWWNIFASGSSMSMPKSNLTLTMSMNLGNGDSEIEVPFYEYGHASDRIYENKSKHQIFYQEFDVQDSVSYNDKIDAKGYKLTNDIPAGYVMPTKPTFKIYEIDRITRSYAGNAGAPRFTNPFACVFVKNFDIVGVMPDDTATNNLGTDTEYTYEAEINNEYVSSLDDITFKICTFDGKNLNYSAVAYPVLATDSHPGYYKFVDKLDHPGLGQAQRSENLMCYKVVNQYSEPSKKLTANLYDTYRPYCIVHEPLLDADMIVDSIKHDYVTDSAEYTLVEKK